jgi:hypothetical protein
MCLYWALKYSIVAGVTWGTMPENLKISWNATSMNCNDVMAQGFKIKHPTNGLYISSIDAGDVVEGAAALRVVLGAAPTYFKLTRSTSFASYIVLQNMVTSNLLRHSDNYFWEDALTATTENFACSVVEAKGGESFHITYIGVYGGVVGYNSTSNRLIRSQVGDSTAVAWQISNYLSE